MNKGKLFTLMGLFALAILFSSFMEQQQEHKAKNLKVLPKNISHEDLDKVMDDFKVALGVKCNFCHAARKDDPKRLDFASDEKPEKEVARKMMRMTANINKKYFHKNGELKGISCKTCHNGKEHPEMTEL